MILLAFLNPKNLIIRFFCESDWYMDIGRIERSNVTVASHRLRRVVSMSDHVWVLSTAAVYDVGVAGGGWKNGLSGAAGAGAAGGGAGEGRTTVAGAGPSSKRRSPLASKAKAEPLLNGTA